MATNPQAKTMRRHSNECSIVKIIDLKKKKRMEKAN